MAMKNVALKITAVVALCLALASCSDRYKTLGTEYGALPPCGQPVYVVSPRGDFSPAQQQDMQAALSDIGFWSNRQVIYAGEVAYRSDTPGRPAGIVAERDNRWQGYALPGKFIRIGSWYSTFPSPTGPTYGYATFRGVFLHEAMHAIVGAADLYNEGDGNPQLIMGKGMLTRNTMNLGDVKAAQAGGCPHA